MTPAFVRVMRAASLALGYPDHEWRQHLPLLHAAAEAVGEPARTHLGSFLATAAARSPGDFQQAYVETFDLRRRCCPYLTYYSCGDTRKRGMALLQFTAAYRAAGFELATGELCPSGYRADRLGARRLPDPRDAGLGAVRRLAVYPPGARLQRAGRLPHEALHRVPLAGRPAVGPPREAGLGAGQAARVLVLVLVLTGWLGVLKL